MKKQEFLQGMHEIYREIYAMHGDKAQYTFDEASSVLQSFLKAFPSAFAIDEQTYQAISLAIIAQLEGTLRDGLRKGVSIDELLLGISIQALRQAGMVSRLFQLKILFWTLAGPLPLAPEQCKKN